MLLFFSLLLYAFHVVAGPTLRHTTHALNPPPSLFGNSRVVSDACQVGNRNILQDGRNLNETLVWDIGTIRATDGEKFCKTVMRMDYDKAWQYAVTDIDWKSHVLLEENTQAAILLSFHFENSNRITRYRWTIDPPKDDEWYQTIRINSGQQTWSPCGQITALEFEWRAGFYLIQGKKGTMSGQLGSRGEEGSNLNLQMGTKWRRCGSR